VTTYAATGTFGFTGTGTNFISPVFAIKVGTYELKVSRIEYGVTTASRGQFAGNYVAIATPTIRVSPSGSISGGTSVTPAPMDQSSPAASSTAAFGKVTTPSNPLVIANAESVSGENDGSFNFATGSFNSYEPPYDLVVSSGSVFSLVLNMTQNNIDTANIAATIFFEELRQSWPR